MRLLHICVLFLGFLAQCLGPAAVSRVLSFDFPVLAFLVELAGACFDFPVLIRSQYVAQLSSRSILLPVRLCSSFPAPRIGFVFPI
jgi:hypothetical protein